MTLKILLTFFPIPCILLSSKTNHFGGYVCHRFILFSTSIMLLENTTY